MKGQPTTAGGKPIGDDGIIEDEQPALPDEGTIALTGDADAGVAGEPTKQGELAAAVAANDADAIVAESKARLVAQRDALVAQMDADAQIKKDAQDRINKARPQVANLTRVINSFDGRTVTRKPKGDK